VNSGLPKFSVLIPVYFKEQPDFLKKALCSILTQSYLPDEVVIVEDGKLTEELYHVINDHKTAQPDLIKTVSLEKNMGIGYAMNFGLKHCRNEYVARMDTDDIAHPDRFLTQMTYLSEHPEVDIIGSFIEEFHQLPGDMKRYRKVPIEHNQIVNYAKLRCPINHMTVIFKKSKVLEAGSYTHIKNSFEDYPLWYRMIKTGSRFYNFPAVLVYVRVGNNMEIRRRGKEYFQHELVFFKAMRTDGFINAFQFYGVLTARFLVRLLPVPVLRIVYDKLLRQHRQ
jgi:glycosyltransferase involved in cell wall biosynthesis